MEEKLKFIRLKTHSKENIQIMMSDKDVEVCKALAGNPTIPISILELFKADPEEKIREILASRWDLTPKLITFLLNDDSSLVRKQIISPDVGSYPIFYQLSCVQSSKSEALHQ